jgi:hypothetical protein
VHPDVRRPWVKVGRWNWKSLFKDTQLAPLYTRYTSPTTDPGIGVGIELFRLHIVDSVNGLPLTSPENGNYAFDFRVCIELAGPIGLVPIPRRFRAGYSLFAGPNNPLIDLSSADPKLNEDKTPVQYKVLSLQNKM